VLVLTVVSTTLATTGGPAGADIGPTPVAGDHSPIQPTVVPGQPAIPRTSAADPRAEAARAMADVPTTSAATEDWDTPPAPCPDGRGDQTWGPGNWCLRSFSWYGGTLPTLGVYTVNANSHTDQTVNISIPLGGLSGNEGELRNMVFSGDRRHVEDNGRYQTGLQVLMDQLACADGSNTCQMVYRAANYPKLPPADPPLKAPNPVWVFWAYNLKSENKCCDLGFAEFAIKIVFTEDGPASTPQPPTADFTATPVAGKPGQFDYRSTSTDPNGEPLTLTWTFSDGTTSTAAAVRHTYTKPGDFPVKLDVKNAHNKTGSVTKTTTVAPPPLSVDISLEGDPEAIDIGDEVKAQVKVSAGTDGVGDLTALKLGGDGLAPSADGVVELSEPLSPAIGSFSLAPGASKTYTTKIKALAAGHVDLLASVGGKDAAGRTVSKDGALPVRVRSAALDLALTLDKDDLTLPEDKDGPTPQTVKLTVKGTNTSDRDLTDITLLSIQPSWQIGLPFTSVFPSSILQPVDGPGDDGLKLGDLSPGQHFEKVFSVKVLDDGHLRLGIDATYVDGGSNELSTGSVDLLSRPKYLLSFSAEADASVDDNPADPWNPPDAVEAGRSFLVLGRMKNLTTDQRIVATVPATGLQQVSSVNLGKLEEDWDNPAMPFRVDIDPGSSQGVKASPVAVPVPGKNGALTYAEYRYAPGGKALLREDDELKAIDPAAVLSTPEQRTFRVAITWPPPAPAPTAIEFYGLFSKAFIESTAAWWANAGASAGNALYAVGELEANAWAVISDPVAREAFREKLAGAWASFVQNIDLMRSTLAAMSPAERLTLINEITNPFLLFLKAGRAIATSEQTRAAAQAIGKAIDAAWTRITTLGGEDPRELARILGSGTGTVFNEVTVGMVTDAAIAKLFTKIRFGSNLAKAQEFVDEAARARAAEGLRIEKGLKGIPEGAALTDEVLTIGLGITRKEKEQILAVAKRFNLNIMARSRGSGAAELIEKGLARLKPFGIDAKNVNDIDVLLGFPKAMKDTVAIKQPRAWADVLASGEYRALDAEQRAQVAARWQTRSKEWSGGGKLKEVAPGEWTVAEAPPNGIGAERQKFLTAADKGTFDLQFPTQGNWEEVAVDGQALGTAKADFGLKRSVQADGSEVLQPYLSDSRGGALKPITGDVDLVALLNPDGTYPDPEKVIAAYMELAKPPLRMQHPATWSFDVQGKSMDLLADHVLGGATAEPLAAFGPTGKITAVLFDPKMSLIPADRRSAGALLIKVAGGIKLPSHAYGLGAALPAFLENGNPNGRSYYLPESWREAERRAGGGSSRSLAPSTAGVRYVRGAPPVQEADDLTLQRFTHGAWRPWAPLPAGVLDIAPQTCLAADLAQGQRHVAVYRRSQLFVEHGSGGQDWFAPGDTVTVDLGAAGSWTTTLTSVTEGSLTFADPAPRAFVAGTALHLRLVGEVGSGGGGGPGTGEGVGSASGGGAGGGPAIGGGELARTGGEPQPLALLGALLIVVGGAALALRPRRPAR
jgi:PKD repeat protein